MTSEASMTSLNGEGERQRGIYWPKIAAMVFVQILVLLALAAMVVRYLESSSDANKAEFLSSTQPAVSDRNLLPQSSAPFERVKARAGCYRKVEWTGPLKSPATPH
jgi:hypothetical protein